MLIMPDIPNGYIVNGVDADNAWSTRIQCVLIDENDADKSIYLSQECRFENVPFAAKNADRPADIIKSLEPHRFLTFTQGGMFHQLRDTDWPCHRPAREVVDLGGQFLIEPVTYPQWNSEVHCPPAAAELISPAELLAGLNDRTIAVGHVHVRVALDGKRSLYFPAGYVNFANRGRESNEYVQSISGDVVFPVETTVACGYMACAVMADGRARVEFVTKTYSDLYRHIVAQTGLQTFGELGERHPLYLGAMDFVVDVEGEVSFYRYVTG